jgi:beta-lactamase regulating signal transducer with metallopeptidase domain/peptidoglycan/xylan/chitin deacetylase (PgdA/CDA1 family)
MILENLANSQLVENLGWTLLHSVWQIAFVALWLFLALRVFAKSAANSRYLVSLFALCLAFLIPLTTFVWLSQKSANVRQGSMNTDTKNAAIINEAFQQAEDVPPLKNTSGENSASENFFISVENLQTGFTENFSALSPILVSLWFLGIILFAVRLFGGIWQLHIYKTRENSSPSEDWQAKFANLGEQLKIKGRVKLLQSKIVETPMVIGWLKPVILVPTSVFLGMNPRELETILAHELEHIRRYDYFVNFAQNFIDIVFFYHPAVWWISANIRRERECACDDGVVKTLENSLFVYANALANLEEFRYRAKQTTSPVLVAANGGKLMKRIQRIINNKNTKRSAAGNSLWSASLACALILAFMIALFSTTTELPVNAQSKLSDGKTRKLAVGFVSIPPVDRMENPPKDADATARLLIEKLKAHRVPAIGFVQGAMISDGEKLYPVRAEIVRMWRDAGFEIGIGGYKHIWFYDTPFDEYVANVEKNEQITKKILAEKNLPLRYFSYPFLNTGKTTDDRNRFENWLNARGLNSVKYTFDNQEWMYSFAYDVARKDNDINTMKEIRAEYLDYMTKMTNHYESYSTEMFRRDINQTLVLTSSRLVADSADDFFGMLQKRGYKFVPMDEALADEAFQTSESFTGKAGISWFERWTITQNKKLRDEPKVSESVEKTWREMKDKK